MLSSSDRSDPGFGSMRQAEVSRDVFRNPAKDAIAANKGEHVPAMVVGSHEHKEMYTYYMYIHLCEHVYVYVYEYVETV